MVMMVHSTGDVEHAFLPDEVGDEDARASPFPLPCLGRSLPQDAKYAISAAPWHNRMVSPWSILSLIDSGIFRQISSLLPHITFTGSPEAIVTLARISKWRLGRLLEPPL